MTKPLDNQSIVITGASSGIGRAAALEFAKRGASVTLAARSQTALYEVRLECERAGGQALVCPTDVSDWDAVEALRRGAADRFGGIDTWINDAAVSEYATVEEMTPEELERIIRVNLLGQI